MQIDPHNPEFCMLNNLRRATRLLALNMDHSLAKLGLKSTQFSLLVTLKTSGAVPVSVLAELMALERTSLTRNLNPLIVKGWVTKVPGEDQRVKLITITEQGREVLANAEACWQEQQMKVVDKLGQGSWLDHYQAVKEIAATAV